MSFEREWKQEFGSVQKQLNKAIVDVGVFGWSSVTAKTPVRTGRARSSWNLSVDVIENQTLPKVKGDNLVYAGREKPLLTFDIEKDKKLFIANNVEYINYLEEGSDTVMAFGMVSTTIPAMNRRLQRNFKGIRVRKI